MFFSRKKKYGAIFEKHYRQSLMHLGSSNIAKGSEFELLPVLSVICDYAAASAGKNRVSISLEVEDSVKEILTKTRGNYQTYKKRMDFYGEVIRGRRLRAEWLMGDISDIERNAIINCMIAFGDILVNPSCVDNYDSAPLVIHDIFLLAEFTALMSNQITQEFVNLFKETYNA